MRTFDLPSLAANLLPSVIAAGAAQMRHYEQGISVTTKADSSPVTAADRESEAILHEGLWQAARGVPVVAEESMALGEGPSRGSTFFLVDPLDGTGDFVDRRAEFSINIGLVVGVEPVFGMIYAPALGLLFVTLDTGHAVETRLPVDTRAPTLASCALQKLSTRHPQLDALTVLEGRSRRRPETDAFLAGYAIDRVRQAGSSLKFCYIARGDADLYVRVGPTKEWDTAAGQAILEAAGGVVTTLGGERLVCGNAEAEYLNPSFVAWGRTPILPRVAKKSSA
jgi:3'(2'), 5'-bisphosphate nucleotidase